MTAIKRSLAEISQASASEPTKTERRRLAKQAKRERKKSNDRRGSRGNVAGGKGLAGQGDDSSNGRGEGKKKKDSKPRMTKEERRAKYTQKAYEARERRSQAGPGAIKTRCLGCRALGHVVANCPDAKAHTGICFNCGSSEHALRACPKRKQKDGSLPHAKCFVCQEKGHISAHCKQNANGIYPKGGSCKVCGSRHHLSKNCPDNPRASEEKNKPENANVAEPSEGDESDGADASLDQAPSWTLAAAEAEKSLYTRRLADPVGASDRGAPRMLGVSRSGGDDLEADNYYEPEDVAGLYADEISDGVEDEMPIGEGMEGPAQQQQRRKKQGKKEAKIVVF